MSTTLEVWAGVMGYEWLQVPYPCRLKSYHLMWTTESLFSMLLALLFVSCTNLYLCQDLLINSVIIANKDKLGHDGIGFSMSFSM